jgi:CRISPR-associated helicase Cas3
MVHTAPPGLTVVMVPMGEGKTEAALGHWMSSAPPGQGLYFALPTMATADAMFDRVRNFFTHTEDPVLGTLAHGRSVLNAFYQTPYRDPELTNDSSGGLVPQDWFTGRHRALLSPITVGTIDQLLAGALRHRYNFLRMLGAATKTVVLDEVHTYDPYMSELLCGFLEWAGWLNIDVVLLSATLPARRLAEYLNAYHAGSGHQETITAPAAYPSVVRLIAGALSTDDLSEELSGRETTVNIHWVGGPVKKVWETAAMEAESALTQFPTAKIGLILNTVAGAQQAAARLVALGLPTSLLHARMSANERFRRTEQAIADFGKKSTTGPAILVATQVVEASIDLDFDILITEICPATSLLQRSGRVWRHNLSGGDRRDRPPGLPAPRVVVVFPDPLQQPSSHISRQRSPKHIRPSGPAPQHIYQFPGMYNS